MAEIAEQAVPRVSQLTRTIRRTLAGLGSGWVEGELQEHQVAGSGHCYLTLADEDTQLHGVVWRSRLRGIGKMPETGSLIQAHYERIDFYPPSGRTSLLIDSIRLTGVGELLERRRRTLEKLVADGLTDPDRKRPVPAYPRAVGVIAARNSSVWADASKSITERFPPVDLIFSPALVEGVRAVDSILGALAALQAEPDVDVIVLVRGGGGVRELVPFDDEGLCRAIAASTVPVVTAVGHTPQRPNCDHVAAAYADVPARAAELVVPSAEDLRQELVRCGERVDQIPQFLARHQSEVEQALARVRPDRALSQYRLGVDGSGERLAGAAERLYAERRRVVDGASHELQRLPGLLPRPEVIGLEGGRLNAAAGRFAATTTSALAELIGRLDSVPPRFHSSARDYRRALDRHLDQGRRAIDRRVAAEEERIADTTSELGRTVSERVSAVRADVERLLELVKAKDPRRRGWPMASDERGRPVSRAAQLSRGQDLTLSFDDGNVETTVGTIEIDEGGRSK